MSCEQVAERTEELSVEPDISVCADCARLTEATIADLKSVMFEEMPRDVVNVVSFFPVRLC